MTKKWAVAVILVLMSAAIAAPLVTRLYRINHRWLLWTPLQSEVWVWPVRFLLSSEPRYGMVARQEFPAGSVGYEGVVRVTRKG